jgi:hypothetical protein
MRHVLVRLRHCLFTFDEVKLALAKFQRAYLDARAFLDWYDIFLPRLDSGYTREVDVTRMGAWTNNAKAVQHLFDMGIPVWYVREDVGLSPTINIANVTHMTPPDPTIIELDPMPLPNFKDGGLLGVFTPGMKLHFVIRRKSLVYDGVDDPLSFTSQPIMIPGIHRIDFIGSATSFVPRTNLGAYEFIP